MTLCGSKLISVQRKVDGTFQRKENQNNIWKNPVAHKTSGGLRR
jgi:hypothetical protein